MTLEQYLNELLNKLEKRGMVARSDRNVTLTTKGDIYVKKFLEKYPEMAILVWLSTP